MMRVAVTGYLGRMGSEVVRAVTGEPDMEVVAKIEVGDELADSLVTSKAEVMVDFTVPETAYRNIMTALDCGVIPVVGTTGLTTEQLATLDARSRELGVPVLVIPNFAIGAVLMMQMSAIAAKYLPDAEVIEYHHERKVDAPSGTAMKTAQMIHDSRTAAPAQLPAGAFEAVQGARGGMAFGSVPVHAVRLPGYVASQEVIFGAPGQRLSIRHDSIDRTSFMPGVVLAVRKSIGRTGLAYGLEHLLT
ncbi:MAG: 4-hydroxy-tetrahydrodipicolinate reductase [Armatimonadota bacterium]